ncbi:MAG TPA: 4Fe-4S binding protein [Bacillota bacterium]|nr:4Fe-4S binding protein [Bacillota bacterium]HPF42355.1 4Fe-4S binding protein [Bacillota bacterium]HPJ86142.1 4Fe-4S binding protein [Bacillota bacterium]HPQ61394.1 4Fe-4S binding protein [Bacillota bacterium]HRX91642.1 4Fe-4S binding protein [Candidatus Izemoplasmatales bacterium]
MTLLKNGVPSQEQVRQKFPSEAVLARPKAILECYEEIPCNPCSTSCPFKAITIGEDINSIPQIDHDKCTGCGICISSCPGLAIIVAQTDSDKAIFKIPYEFIPVPVPGEKWIGLDRSGNPICEALIVKADTKKTNDRTVVVTVETERRFLYDFITIRCPYE